jgi:hypothetical protein
VNQRHRPPFSATLELAVAAQVTILMVGVSWAFGGNADWVRTPICLWGSVGIALTLLLVAGPGRGALRPGTTPWAWPIVVLNAIVAISCLTPGYRYLSMGGGTFVMPLRVDWWIPSAARSGVALNALWLFDGLYFSCLNLALAVVQRKVIRIVLGAAVANALALSVFGTVQKLSGATGIYFGSVGTPHLQFFASFVYDNHWGAFIILMMGACVGLVLRYAHGTRGEGFFRGPASAGLVTAALMALTVPLSGSRACTFLLGIMTLVAVVRGVPRISRALRLSGVTRTGALAGMALAALAIGASVWFVAGDVIQARASKTKEQVSEMWAQGGLGSRSVLYHDTLRMAHDRILFGWGMGSFPSVFQLYNTAESKIDRLPVIYHDAHCDWLQSVAELGLAGTALLGAAVALPLFSVRRSRLNSLPYFLLCGCILTAAYAWIEFPFGNVAVVLAWWLCFFSAVHYMRLTSEGDGAARGA